MGLCNLKYVLFLKLGVNFDVMIDACHCRGGTRMVFPLHFVRRQVYSEGLGQQSCPVPVPMEDNRAVD